jgi:hypothetical protein
MTTLYGIYLIAHFMQALYPNQSRRKRLQIQMLRPTCHAVPRHQARRNRHQNLPPLRTRRRQQPSVLPQRAARHPSRFSQL